ncbi:MAG: hypothetical protein KTU85_07750 [Acidimicrobiia bacterium]|nr:hypothetical protein [Acidimicrobiia bacterium]MCY4458549.1 hypothetical protein [Acidimicrobiaceae bacterium]
MNTTPTAIPADYRDSTAEGDNKGVTRAQPTSAVRYTATRCITEVLDEDRG